MTSEDVSEEVPECREPLGGAWGRGALKLKLSVKQQHGRGWLGCRFGVRATSALRDLAGSVIWVCGGVLDDVRAGIPVTAPPHFSSRHSICILLVTMACDTSRVGGLLHATLTAT